MMGFSPSAVITSEGSRLTPTVLDELIDRYGTHAVISVDPYMPDNSGEILRWVLQIDGKEVPDIDVRTAPEGDDWMLMLLVRGDEEFELGRWRESTHPGGHRFVDTLGGLKRRRDHLR